MEILVVEDEAGIADFLARGLEAEGYGVTVGRRRRSPGERLALAPGTDLVVLDRMLPGRDGIEVLAAIRRAKPALPVILLTAKAEVADRVEGLDLGATDYVTKPFAFEELLARIRARLRESGDGSETTLEAGGIRLDLLTREATRGEPRGPAARARGGAARLPDAPRRPGLHPRGDPRRGLGLRARPRHQRRPGLRRLPAPQARPARLAGADRDRALGRLPARASADEARLGAARPARQAGALDRRRSSWSPSPSSSSPCGRRWRTSRRVIKREEAREHSEPGRARPSRARARRSRRSRTPSPTSRRPSCSSAAATLVAALLAGYLLAARTASPLRRFAATAAEVDAGDLTPRLEPEPGDAAELRTLAEAFNHMLDRLDRRLRRGSGSSSPTPRTSCAAR